MVGAPEVSSKADVLLQGRRHEPGIATRALPRDVGHAHFRQGFQPFKQGWRDAHEGVVADVDGLQLDVVREHVASDGLKIRTLHRLS